MSLYDDSPIPGMHPRQAAILIEVPEHARQAVRSRAWLLQNLGGGVFSQCLAAAKRDLDRLGGDLVALEALCRRDNHSAMMSCAHKGCSACARDTR